MRSAFSRRAHRRSGATSLETALVLLAFLMLLLGVIDVARYLFALQSLDDLANRAVRAGIASDTLVLGHGGSACPLAATAGLPFTLPPFLDPATTVCIVQGTISGSRVVTVTVTSPFSAVTPGLSALTSSGAMTQTVQMAY
jgi:hypothetical protein